MPGDQRKSGFPQACPQWLGGVAANLRKSSVWQPLVKNVLSTTITIIIGVIPAIVKVYGTSPFLGAMTSIFGQPGQSFGKSKSYYDILPSRYLCPVSLLTFFGEYGNHRFSILDGVL